MFGEIYATERRKKNNGTHKQERQKETLNVNKAFIVAAAVHSNMDR